MISDDQRLPNPYVTCPFAPCSSAGPRCNLAGESRNRPDWSSQRLHHSGRVMGGNCQRLGMHVCFPSDEQPVVPSSSVVLCGMANGSGGPPIGNSLTIALIYGVLRILKTVGHEIAPTTDPFRLGTPSIFWMLNHRANAHSSTQYKCF